MAPLLTSQNYNQGFLVDEELMAGVTRDPVDPNGPGIYVAFVLQHSTGEYLGYQPYPDLQPALDAINRIPREWTFEKLGGGCGKDCGKKGSCSKGSCCGSAGGICKT